MFGREFFRRCNEAFGNYYWKLQEVKLRRRVSKHLKNELGIFEIILKMDEKDAKAFLDWYLNHPYRKGIEEVITIVGKGTNRTLEEGGLTTNQ